MKLGEYEAAAERTANRSLSERDRLMDAAAGLAEESAEVLALVRKHTFQGKKMPIERLQEELGDALWCLAMTARFSGLTLEQVAAFNIAKLKKRHGV
jgi:NTP pyrophosphatase (non-canonical NTP hydrolase)